MDEFDSLKEMKDKNLTRSPWIRSEYSSISFSIRVLVFKEMERSSF